MSATQIKTCKDCSFARLIEDDRYVCTASETASDTVRGHWEVTRASCHDAIAKLATPESTPVETPRIPRRTRITNHPFRYRWDIHQGGHDFTASLYNLCECSDCYPAEPQPSDEPPLTETTTFDPEQTVTVDVTPEPDEDSHSTPEQFPPDLNIEALAADARREQNEARRLSRVVPVSAVQAIAKVPDYYIRRIEGAGTLRPDTVLAFMRIWGAAQSNASEISKTVNWLIDAPGFDMTNTLLVESLIGIQRPVPPGNQSYFGVDLREEIDPEPENYHDKY